jgi:hypothetical protein
MRKYVFMDGKVLNKVKIAVEIWENSCRGMEIIMTNKERVNYDVTQE